MNILLAIKNQNGTNLLLCRSLPIRLILKILQPVKKYEKGYKGLQRKLLIASKILCLINSRSTYFLKFIISVLIYACCYGSKYRPDYLGSSVNYFEYRDSHLGSFLDKTFTTV